MPTQGIQTSAQTAALTAAAMVAFAANSLLCRMALGAGLIDWASFTSIRVVAGAITLSLILFFQRRPRAGTNADWRSAAMLFTYMVFFSSAYLSLSAGTGALILFGAVQLTMFTTALWQGERFEPLSWAGLALAVGGLVYLVSPGLSAPDPFGAGLMAVAGVAWGVYSLLGRKAGDPLEATTRAFVYCVPPVLILVAVHTYASAAWATTGGVALAVASGAIASGCGYVIWYAALRGLSATSAAVVQLSAPVIAAFAGVILLSEDVTFRLILASVGTLGGVTIVLMQRAAKR